MHKILTIFQWITGFVIATGVTVFALLNRDIVTVIWSPLHPAQDVPLFLPAITFLVFGFLLGVASMWVNSASQRRDKKALKRKIKEFEKKLHGSSGNALPLSGFTALSGPRKKD